MALHLPPIVKAAERLQVVIEHAVARFTRSFRYTFGTELRALALKVTVLAHRAWREVDARARLVEKLSRKVDRLKLLVHHDRAQLEVWRVAIEQFLRRELRLELKDDVRLRRLTDGIDFLGYVVYPTHTRVRRRVIGHVNESLSAWERRHVAGGRVRGTPEHFRGVRSSWASYLGHLRHADGHRLQQRMRRRYPWLDVATTRTFHHTAEGRIASFAIDGAAR